MRKNSVPVLKLLTLFVSFPVGSLLLSVDAFFSLSISSSETLYLRKASISSASPITRRLQMRSYLLQPHPYRNINNQQQPLTMVSSDVSLLEDAAKNVNIPFDSILNMRDLSTASSSKVAPGKLYRTGCVSGATVADVEKCDGLGIKVWIDLRSELEVEEDVDINSAIYNNVMNVRYDRDADEWKLDNNNLQSSSSGKMRYFIALMNEGVIKKGVFQRLKKRAKLLVATLAPLSSTSKRMDQKVKSIFLKVINSGGLALLNELAIEKSPEALISCLKIITIEAEHKAVGVFCTAGKDRTGLICALTLSILGATDDEIIADYILSDSVYGQLKSSAKVASLSQHDLDPDIFLRAKAPVIMETLEFMREKFGSVEEFLDTYGFNEDWRTRLRNNIGR